MANAPEKRSTITTRLKTNHGIVAMNLNESSTDRTVRTILGLTILALGLVLGSWWGLLGAIPLFTGLAGWCPVYQMLGFTTSRKPRARFDAPRSRFEAGTGAL